MLKHHGRAAVIALLSLLATSIASFAQSPVLADIRAAIVRTVGAQPETVEIAITGNIFTVLRVNSNMNASTHGGRDNEASAIAPIVVKAIAGKAEFSNLNTIRVQYVARPAPDAASTVIDTVDFRKTPAGTFEFHKT